ncbi:MAG: MATE family efflux transporter [Alistipes sp.]|nr:MATE family efflux transporter [Alistipes sp.]MBQ6572557.1 MATE family efflux transporter [Alistipes sp.]
MRMNREILRIAIPNIISNITVPIMGIVGTMIAGHLGDSVSTIGALAIGVSIFNFIYWNCSFIRMGTSGITAQAYGAGDQRTTTLMLARATVVSLVVGVAIVVLQRPLGEVALRLMNGGEMVADYFYARVWAVPAGVLLFGLNGWLTGMQNAIIPMVVAIVVNVIHIVCSLWFAFPLGMGIVGIAYASVVAQWTGVAITALIMWWHYGKQLVRISWSEIWDMKAMREFFSINRDIIVRTLCIVSTYTFFTAASARMDDPTILAVNTILLELFTLFSYMSDGFAFAAEALTGRFIGERNGVALRDCVRKCMVWCAVICVLYVGLYVGWWRELLGLFVEDGAENTAQIMEYAGRYIGWIVAIPVAASWPFMMDGIMVGATQSRIMRNSMLWATAAYFLLFFTLEPLIGNDALWLAFTSYMFLRGVFQYFMSDRLRAVYRQAE